MTTELPPHQDPPAPASEIGGIVGRKPQRIQLLGWLLIVDAIFNALWGLFLLWTIICSPGMIYGYFVGTVGLIYASQIMPRHPYIVEPHKRLAWLQIVNILTLNVVSPIIGIVSLIIYRHPDVQAYYHWLTTHGQKPRSLND